MSTPISRDAFTACCPNCRLLHTSPARRCRHCAEQTTVALADLVSTTTRRRLQRRTPTKRGWRWYDVVFLALAVLAPVDAERRYPRWGVAVLVVVLVLWMLVKLVAALLSRYRFVASRGPSTVDTAPSQRVRARDAAVIRGIARRLDDTVAAHLVDRRCLAASLTLELEAQPGAGRLRTLRAAPFIVEDGEALVVVRGHIELVGPATSTCPSAGASAKLGVATLDDAWLVDAVLREVLLQNRNRVEVCGGERRAEAIAALAKRRGAEPITVIEGVAGKPVCVTLAPKLGAASGE